MAKSKFDKLENKLISISKKHIKELIKLQKKKEKLEIKDAKGWLVISALEKKEEDICITLINEIRRLLKTLTRELIEKRNEGK